MVDEKPAFEVLKLDGSNVVGKMAVYADGRIEGFPEGYTVVINRIPLREAILAAHYTNAA